jgi:hypothetical protein
MKGVFFYLSRGIISLVYCMSFRFIIHLSFEIDWGAGVMIGGFIMLVIGLLKTSSSGISMPYSQGSPNPNAIDCTALRTTMDVGTLVGEANKDMTTNRSTSHINGAKSFNILDYMYKRTTIELIIHGSLGIGIGLSTYMAYFV